MKAAGWFVALTSLVVAQGPAPEWSRGYGHGGVVGAVRAAIEFDDDGGGPALFLGGDIDRAGDEPAARYARWRDGRWTTTGAAALGASLETFAIFDDGSGPKLYAGGAPSPLDGRALFRWDGAAWTGVGPPTTANGLPATITRLHAFDDGTGAKLYVSGTFDAAGGVVGLPNFAAFDGANWSAAGGSTTWGTVRAMCTATIGGLPALYAAWGSSVRSYAGGAWTTTPLGALTRVVSGFPQPATIHALEAIVEGGVTRLYAGGDFTHQGGVSCGPLLRFDGAQWATPWQGPPASVTATIADVRALRRRAVGGVDELLVGGYFHFAGPTPAANFARMTSVGHLPLGATSVIGDAGDVLTLFHEHGVEFVVSDFVHAAPTATSPPSGYAPGRFDGAVWGALDPRATPSPGARFAADGSTPEGGALWAAAGGALRRRRNEAWEAVAPFPSPSQLTLAPQFVFDVQATTLAGVPRTFAAGRLFSAPAATVPDLVMEVVNGALVPVGAGLKGPHLGAQALALAAGDLGAGPRLFAGGFTMTLPNQSLVGVAQWNGAAWSAVGGPVVGPVYDLEVWDDGGGPDLYAAGGFTSAGGVAATTNVARWNGSSWSAVGASLNGVVADLLVFDDGTGAALYAAGGFTASGSVPVQGVGRFDGSSWTQVGQGLPTTFGVNAAPVRTLAAIDLGQGPRLYAGGLLGPAYPSGLAVLEGGAWVPVPGLTTLSVVTPNVEVTALVALQDHDGPALFVQGVFDHVNGRPAPQVARLAPPRPQADLRRENGGVVFALEGLVPGRTYQSVFSFDGGAGPVGLGPYLGLYAVDPATLIAQLFLPPGAEPFTFTAAAPDYTFGPVFLTPPGTTIDAMTADLGPGGPLVLSRIVRVLSP